MTSYKIKQFRQIPPFKSLILLVFVFSINFCFGQDKIINEIKSYNEEGNYQKSVKQIKKYQDKKYDTLNYNYLIALADYYCIPKNNEYSPFKAISIVKDINCAKISAEILGIYFKDNQDCNLVLKNKNDRYVSLYFEIIYNSNDLDTLKSFYTDFKSYSEYKNKVYQKIALISFNKAKQTNSKSELLNFQRDYSNTSFASEATVLIEAIDYESATSSNSIESYTAFLKNYPQTNKRNIILSKLEALKWQECVTLNTKNSFQTFINDFPNSTKLQEAKMMLSKFVDVYNLEQINSFYTISNDKQMFKPFKIINGNLNHLNLTLLQISHNGKTALANGGNTIESNNIARLIDITDGAIFFEFPYVNLSNYFFNSDDSKLFYYDNKFIKQIDLNSFEIINLFEIESNPYNFQYMCLENNTIHFCQDQYESPRKKFLHYTYDLTTSKKDLEVFYEFDYSVKGDIQKEFSGFLGSTEEKLLKLKLIYGDDIKIKPLTSKSKDEYLILKFPNVFILKKGDLVFANSLQLYKTDKITKEINRDYYDRSQNEYNRGYGKIQLTANNEIVFAAGKSLFVLKLDNDNFEYSDGNINFQHVDPVEIKISTSDRYIFAHLDSKSGKLYYQIDGNSEVDDVVFVNNYNATNNFNSDQLKLKVCSKLEEIDKVLYSYFSSSLNPETIKNQPLESDNEKYVRLRSIYLKMNTTFSNIKDSLFYSLNEIVKDSIKFVKYDPVKVFITSNYNVDKEYWRLAIQNPFNGKNISIIYNQQKADAKFNLSNDFSNISLEVKYYYNLISLTYEPILVSITNKQSKICDKYFIPFKDESLCKNLYLTDNSYFVNKYDLVADQLWNEYISYDENILRYFVNNGKPKYYFNYGFGDPAQSNKPGVSIRNLDDSNINFDFNNKFEDCCPSSIETYRNYDAPGGKYLYFDDVNYFINQSVVTSSEQLEASVYEINKTSPIGKMGDSFYQGKRNIRNDWEIKDNIVKGDNRGDYSKITAATLEIIDSKLSAAVKTFNIIELGGYSGRIESLDYDASISPNGKLFAVRCNTKTYLYETSNWTNVMNFDNTSGKLYWDCNSYYLGVGNDLIPVLLLDF
jgi:TolA-binding protein